MKVLNVERWRHWHVIDTFTHQSVVPRFQMHVDINNSASRAPIQAVQDSDSKFIVAPPTFLMRPLDMTSEFQLDPLLLLRPSSPGEDEILPAITALYLSSSTDSVSGSEQDVEEQDCEWREAIRVALEEVSWSSTRSFYTLD